MTTKRFKAVCTETWREFWPDRQGLDKNNPPWLERKTRNLYGWSVQAWIPIKHTNIKLCQSTGLTDAKGQEVYEGDVLYDIGGSEIEDEDIIGNMRIIEFDGIGFDFFCYFDSSRDDGYKDFHRYLSHHVVIGNRFMPQAELQARAEAVSDRY